MDTELGRLTELYAGLSDDQLLNLVRTKAELTAVAGQALEAEIEMRGLTLEAEAEGAAEEPMPELAESDDDPDVVELMTFQLAGEAEKALRMLDDSGIPVEMKPAMRQMEENGPKIKTSWLTIFVAKADQQAAVKVLRETMGLFPVLSAEEQDEDHTAGAEELFPLGEFEAADVPQAERVLNEAGIWFKATPDEGAGTMTFLEVKFEDLERAVDVIDGAF